MSEIKTRSLKKIILFWLVLIYGIACLSAPWLDFYLIDDFNLWIPAVFAVPVSVIFYMSVKFDNVDGSLRSLLVYPLFPVLFLGLNLTIVNTSIPWLYTSIVGEPFTLQAEIILKKISRGGRSSNFYLGIASRRENYQGEFLSMRYQFFDNRGLNKNGLSVSKNFYKQVKLGDKIVIKGLKSDIGWNIKSYELDVGK